MKATRVMIDGNEAAAYVAFRTNEVIAIYPITPSSNMGEWADEWAAAGKTNIWGDVPLIQEMQSEGGAAGAVHGALQTGALTTTFTASQGLLLMIPNMFKIAGELTPTVFHIAARSVACQALSIFGDHSDVMATRSTGYAMLAANSVQEVMDFALIAQAASLEARIPFLHFFDGFRTSHEVTKIERIEEDVIRAMIDEEWVRAHRARALSCDRPVIRGTAQNPDVFFQARETVNRYYAACPDVVAGAMERFAGLTGRRYRPFDYVGPRDAERVLVLMGSGAETAHETVAYLNARGEKVGVIKVRLYRPFSIPHFFAAVPPSVKAVAVLDRTKEPGSCGEPLYLDVVNAFVEDGADRGFASPPRIVGGRYGLSSKEFTPAMVKAVFDELKKDEPKNHFTVGIVDDVTHTSLDVDETFCTEDEKCVRCIFYGLGADGTVSANKNSIKIIGENTDNYAQGYFVYDSKKSGSMTISHLRFGPNPIRSTYLVASANFIGCHQFNFVEKYDVLKDAAEGCVFLLNSPFGADEVWQRLPRRIQEELISKKMRFFVIDAYKVAAETGMGVRINTIMQTCFFAISGVLPREEAVAQIKAFIEKSYGKKGAEVVQKNFHAVDQALANLREVRIPSCADSEREFLPPVVGDAPDFVRKVTARIIAREGDALPVSALPEDGTYPVGTTRWEKRNIALEIPVWEPDICIQCGKCVLVCPHAVIRSKVFDPARINGRAEALRHTKAKDRAFEGREFVIQVSPMDCTGCALCVDVCPAKSKTEAKVKAINMHSIRPILDEENRRWEAFLDLPEVERERVKQGSVRGAQFLRPLFEFSGACAGCGETPYLKLLTQLFGDRALVANATGCSSIYGGNLPTTPWAAGADGRGPAWSNSLFEDNAEFGLGFRLAVDEQARIARTLLQTLAPQIGDDALVREILEADQSDEPGIFAQRERVARLKEILGGIDAPEARRLQDVADMLVKKSVWIVGGDGWAYDIGFGGLDHVLASSYNINVLVLDTEVYSNTGGQMSKATPRAAVAKFAASGKPLPKKDLARIAMSYGHVYVANVAMGAKDEHTVRAFIEAEAYDGPSLIIAYSHCIAHGTDMSAGLQDHKAAVLSGHWPLFRYNPSLAGEGKNPFSLDSSAPKIPFSEFAYRQNRFKMLTKTKPELAKQLIALAQEDVRRRWRIYEEMQRAEVS